MSSLSTKASEHLKREHALIHYRQHQRAVYEAKQREAQALIWFGMVGGILTVLPVAFLGAPFFVLTALLLIAAVVGFTMLLTNEAQNQARQRKFRHDLEQLNQNKPSTKPVLERALLVEQTLFEEEMDLSDFIPDEKSWKINPAYLSKEQSALVQLAQTASSEPKKGKPVKRVKFFLSGIKDEPVNNQNNQKIGYN
jgi:hypothetical protein